MGTVTKLPTAARRQVNNSRFAAQRQARVAAIKAQPWPGEHVRPGMRSAKRLAEELSEIKQTPALIAVSAILRCLDDETYRKVLEQLAPAINAESGPGRQALATARASRLDVGDQLDLYRAVDELRGEER